MDVPCPQSKTEKHQVMILFTLSVLLWIIAFGFTRQEMIALRKQKRQAKIQHDDFYIH